MITSPTYEGVISDIEGNAKVAHVHGIPLIVDSAHGAHLGFGGEFPQNAVRLGADAVIESLHKTLPSFTQTALLHLNSDLISKSRIEKYLGIYETSSPSYILMAGMEVCIRPGDCTVPAKLFPALFHIRIIPVGKNLLRALHIRDHFLGDMWEAVCRDEVFFGDWMPELARFLG